MENYKVVVTGLGCVTAGGLSVDSVMANMYAGKREPAPPQRIKTDLANPFPVFEIKENVEPNIVQPFDNPLEFSKLSLTNKYSLAALKEAAYQAKINLNDLPDLKIGVSIGTTVGCSLNNEEFYRDFKNDKFPDITPFSDFLGSNPAELIAKSYKLDGPVSCVSNACSAGTDAIGQAKLWIESGICDIVICGGSDELCRVTYLGFASLLVTSPEPCAPFDNSRKGLNLGEGAGILIVESHDSAIRRKVEPLAEIVGYASRSDAYHPTGPHPEGKGLRGAIYKSFGQHNLKPQDIGFVNAHGTATIENDRVEGRAIRDVFPKNTPVVSTKAYTGHTLGAAGALEAIFTIRALIDKTLPATAGFYQFDPDCMIEPTMEKIKINAEMGISNSLAFGGTNSVLIFRR